MRLKQIIDFRFKVKNWKLILAPKSVAYKQENSLNDDQWNAHAKLKHLKEPVTLRLKRLIRTYPKSVVT